MVTLFVSDHAMCRLKKTFHCVSTNESGHSVRTLAIPLYTSVPIPFCKWTLYIAICAVVDEPIEFKIKKIGGGEVKVPFRHPVRENLDVVACLSPLFMNEHWQLLLTSLEIRRKFGVSLQVVYIYSMRSELFEILKAYESAGLVSIEKWHSVHLGDDVDIGYDPNYELVWRNQAAAHTDCFLKYRVSTKYIMIGDIDDVLVPRIAPTYIEEFHKLNTANDASALMYPRYDIGIYTSSQAKDFSITKIFEQSLVQNSAGDGKQVAITGNVLAVDLHWPSLYKGKMKTISTNYMFHLRNWYYDQEPDVFDKDKSLQKLLGRNALLEIEEQFNVFKNRTFQDAFSKLYSELIYFPLIDSCYDETFYKYWRNEKLPPKCPGPIRCNIPKMPGIRCTIAKAQTEHHRFESKNTTIHFAIITEFVEYDDGCDFD